jgi:hypothetical protein
MGYDNQNKKYGMVLFHYCLMLKKMNGIGWVKNGHYTGRIKWFPNLLIYSQLPKWTFSMTIATAGEGRLKANLMSGVSARGGSI